MSAKLPVSSLASNVVPSSGLKSFTSSKWFTAISLFGLGMLLIYVISRIRKQDKIIASIREKKAQGVSESDVQAIVQNYMSNPANIPLFSQIVTTVNRAYPRPQQQYVQPQQPQHAQQPQHPQLQQPQPPHPQQYAQTQQPQPPQQFRHYEQQPPPPYDGFEEFSEEEWIESQDNDENVSPVSEQGDYLETIHEEENNEENDTPVNNRTLDIEEPKIEVIEESTGARKRKRLNNE